MIDYGGRRTNLAVKRAEGEIRLIYQQAAREIEEKTKEWREGHARRDAKYRQMVKDGKMSKADYEAWMRGQVFQEKQWKAKQAQIQATLLNADKAAMAVVNQGKLGVFAVNANYIGYGLEHDSGLNTGFTLYDENTVARLIRDNPKILPMLPPEKAVLKDKAYPYYNRLMNRAITQGIIQGESIQDIAFRVARTTGESSYKSAMRNARTAYTGAQNAGRMEGLHQAQALGIKVKKRWLAILDSKTRDSHAELDGQVQEVDDPFESPLGNIMYPGDASADDPADVYNCFVGETNVATDSEIIRSYKHEYAGELVTIETASGVNFTCTPNHPILTPSGWVAAKSLNNGDNLLIAGFGGNLTSRVNPNVNHTFSRIDALHKFFDITGSKRTVRLGVNFHGDVPTSDVEVITQKGFLRCDRNSCGSDSVNELLLKHSDKSLMGKSAFMQHFGSIRFAALRLISSAGKSLSFLRGRLSHSIIHGFRAVTRGNSTVLQPKPNDVSGDMEFIGQCLDRFPGKVFVDNVINIKVSTVSHISVFNLQTDNGYYFVNNIIPQSREKCNGNFAIAHNCRCTLTYVYPEYPSSMQRRDAETGEVIEDMTYREWEQWKRGDGDEPQSENTVVEGNDISDTWERRPDEFDFEINDVINAQGFDGVPRVVDDDEFERAVRESGFIAQRSYSAPDQEILDAYRDQLYHGEWYVDCGTGGAQYGQGMYCAADYNGELTDGIKAEMEHYRNLGESRYETHFDAGTARERKFEMAEAAGNEVLANGGTMQDARAAYDKIMNTSDLEWAEKYAPELLPQKGVSYTETLTLAPDAKIVTWREINDIRTGTLGIEYRNEVLEEELKRRGLSGDELTFARYNAGLGVSWNEVDAAARRLGAEKRNAVMEQLEDAGNTAQRRFNEEQERRRERARIYQEKYHDIGSLAAALGYDAINAENHGQSGSYTVILNRTKVIIRRPK
jgi:hypothetical protein